MELRETERNYVTMLSNIIRVRYETRYTKFLTSDNPDCYDKLLEKEFILDEYLNMISS